jgi:type IV secretion system protein TrbD
VTPRPIPRVLWRNNLLLGGERDLVMFGALLFGSVGMSASNLVAYVVCGIGWAGWLAACRWLAKADPQMSKVQIRKLKYRAYYAAHSRPYRKT